jgi:hypothetical protein
MASAQVGRDRDPNPALWQATPDAAALGSTSRAFLEAGRTGEDNSWLASTGFELAGGMLRATYGYRAMYRSSPRRDYALGYARQITQQDLGLFGSWSTGMDFTAAYQSTALWWQNARAARLAIPVSFRWGSPSRISLAPYVAPYAEFGHATLVSSAANCSTGSCLFAPDFNGGSTYSTGLGVGAELTVWRLGLTIGSMGIPRRLNLYDNGRWITTASVRLRF